MAATDADADQGSWAPIVIILALILLRWIIYGQGNAPVRFRRWYNMKRVKLRKKLGYRDESKYQMGAGDGSNVQHKRQG